MGANGPEIFDDDVACDVRATFQADLKKGEDVQFATQHVRQKYRNHIKDYDDGPTVWFALALLQLDHGALQNEVRENALKAIEDGTGMSRWKEEIPVRQQERRAVLDELRSLLAKAERF
jgi:hypothetical protein